MARYIYYLRAPRLTFAEDATEEEKAHVSDHFYYLQRLLEQKVLILAGRALDLHHPAVAIFEAADDDQARQIMEGDPAVKACVFTAEVAPFRIALHRDAEPG